MNKYKLFKEQFPELNGREVYNKDYSEIEYYKENAGDEISEDVHLFDGLDIKKYCLSKQRVKKAINEVINHGSEREVKIAEYLFQKLDLEDEVKRMNMAQQHSIYLIKILEESKDLDFISDGINGGLDIHFKDTSKLNIHEVER